MRKISSQDYGNHIILDLYDCDITKLFFTDDIISTISNIISRNYGTIENKTQHIFPNNAYTLLFLLSESHFSVHTFPENNYASIDIYTCGGNVLTFNIATEIIHYYKSLNCKYYHIIRNNINKVEEVKYNLNDYIILKENNKFLLENIKIEYNKDNFIILRDKKDEIYYLDNNKMVDEKILDGLIKNL